MADSYDAIMADSGDRNPVERVQAILEYMRANVYGHPGPEATRWIEKGGSVVGVLYGYLPLELFEACGVLPVRLHPLTSQSAAEAKKRFLDTTCSWARHLYSAADRGEYRYLSGIASVNVCDHERRLFDNWIDVLGAEWSHFAVMPKKSGEAQVGFFAGQLRSLCESAALAFGAKNVDDNLREALVLSNEIRAKVRSIADLRRGRGHVLPSGEFLVLCLARGTMPPSRYLDALGRLHAALEEVPEKRGGEALPILVYGGDIDRPEIFYGIESAGMRVADECTGLGISQFCTDVAPEGDPYTSLARAVMSSRIDPRFFDDPNSRAEALFSRMEESGARAIVVPTTNLCDYWEWEARTLKMIADRRGIPLLTFGLEYGDELPAQAKTRLQACAEMLAR